MKYLKIFCAIVVVAIASILTVVMFLFYVVFARYKISSSSMMPTIEVGDQILVNRFAYLRSHPSHNDIITFRSPVDSSKVVLGRVVGLPGDTVSLNKFTLHRNGERVSEPHAIYADGGQIPLSATTVREGCLLVMGDNRDQSRDSRLFPDYCVPFSNVKGQVKAIYLSTVGTSRIGFLK